MSDKSHKSDKRPTIYLAGPISGCNTKQRSAWRENVKNRWKDHFKFIDPAVDIVDHQKPGAKYEIIKQDESSIRKSDGVLANMWCNSIGTAIGVLQARSKGKPVVVVDQNYISSSVLAYYCDGVYDSVNEAMKYLQTILQGQQRIKGVIKKSGGKSGKPEEFDRLKIFDSIRKACRDVELDDLTVPARIAPPVLKDIIEHAKLVGGMLSTSEIKKHIFDMLGKLESDPVHGEDARMVRDAWEKYEYDKQQKKGILPVLTAQAKIIVAETPFDIEVCTSGTHTSIWGINVMRIEDLPAGPRNLFSTIMRVSGIKRITLGKMMEGHDHNHCCADIFAYKNPGVIGGKCYDVGTKGQAQLFFIHVADSKLTQTIRDTMHELLKKEGLLVKR